MHDLRDRACIVGIGETRYLRKSGQTAHEMVYEAVERACQDAGIGVRDLDGVVQMGGAGHLVTAQEFQLNYGIADLPYVATAPFGAGSAVGLVGTSVQPLSPAAFLARSGSGDGGCYWATSSSSDQVSGKTIDVRAKLPPSHDGIVIPDM